MRRAYLLLLSTALAPALVIALQSSAHAQFQVGEFADNWRHGSACVPTTPADAAKITYDQWGVHNISTSSSASVSCGTQGIWNSPQNTSDFTGVLVWDVVTTGNIACTVHAVSKEGFLFWSETKNTSGALNQVHLLGWNPPLSTVFARYYFQCTLPRAHTDGRAAYVSSFAHY